MKDCANLDKQKIRNEFLEKRRKIPCAILEQKSAEIFERVKTLPVYTASKTVMFYLSFDGEVMTDKMIGSALKDGKAVAVPVIKNHEKREMGAFEIKSLDFQGDIVMGIRQPKIEDATELSKSDIDLIFVPGIVFDLERFRIGYGGGFFDRYLERFAKEKTVGLCYDFQIIDKIPSRSSYDAQLGVVLSEGRIF